MDFSRNSAQPRILLVDSSQGSRQRVYDLLKESGYSEISEAKTSKEAMEVLQNELNLRPHEVPFHFILKDHEPPDINAVRLLQKMQGDARLSQIPLVAYSSQDTKETVFTCLQNGAFDYLIKPLRQHELRNLWTKISFSRAMQGPQQLHQYAFPHPHHPHGSALPNAGQIPPTSGNPNNASPALPFNKDAAELNNNDADEPNSKEGSAPDNNTRGDKKSGDKTREPQTNDQRGNNNSGSGKNGNGSASNKIGSNGNGASTTRHVDKGALRASIGLPTASGLGPSPIQMAGTLAAGAALPPPLPSASAPPLQSPLPPAPALQHNQNQSQNPTQNQAQNYANTSILGTVNPSTTNTTHTTTNTAVGLLQLNANAAMPTVENYIKHATFPPVVPEEAPPSFANPALQAPKPGGGPGSGAGASNAPLQVPPSNPAAANFANLKNVNFAAPEIATVNLAQQWGNSTAAVLPPQAALQYNQKVLLNEMSGPNTSDQLPFHPSHPETFPAHLRSAPLLLPSEENPYPAAPAPPAHLLNPFGQGQASPRAVHRAQTATKNMVRGGSSNALVTNTAPGGPAFPSRSLSPLRQASYPTHGPHGSLPPHQINKRSTGASNLLSSGGSGLTQNVAAALPGTFQNPFAAFAPAAPQIGSASTSTQAAAEAALKHLQSLQQAQAAAQPETQPPPPEPKVAAVSDNLPSEQYRAQQGNVKQAMGGVGLGQPPLNVQVLPNPQAALMQAALQLNLQQSAAAAQNPGAFHSQPQPIPINPFAAGPSQVQFGGGPGPGGAAGMPPMTQNVNPFAAMGGFDSLVGLTGTNPMMAAAGLDPTGLSQWLPLPALGTRPLPLPVNINVNPSPPTHGGMHHIHFPHSQHLHPSRGTPTSSGRAMQAHHPHSQTNLAPLANLTLLQLHMHTNSGAPSENATPKSHATQGTPGGGGGGAVTPANRAAAAAQTAVQQPSGNVAAAAARIASEAAVPQEMTRSELRQAALEKYRAKRKNLKFGKRIRYESRKKMAENRPRVKGQFIKKEASGAGGQMPSLPTTTRDEDENEPDEDPDLDADQDGEDLGRQDGSGDRGTTSHQPPISSPHDTDEREQAQLNSPSLKPMGLRSPAMKPENNESPAPALLLGGAGAGAGGERVTRGLKRKGAEALEGPGPALEIRKDSSDGSPEDEGVVNSPGGLGALGGGPAVPNLNLNLEGPPAAKKRVLAQGGRGGRGGQSAGRGPTPPLLAPNPLAPPTGTQTATTTRVLNTNVRTSPIQQGGEGGGGSPGLQAQGQHRRSHGHPRSTRKNPTQGGGGAGGSQQVQGRRQPDQVVNKAPSSRAIDIAKSKGPNQTNGSDSGSNSPHD